MSILTVPSSALDLGRKLINYLDLFPKYSVPHHSGLKTNILEYFPNGLTFTLDTLVWVSEDCNILGEDCNILGEDTIWMDGYFKVIRGGEISQI